MKLKALILGLFVIGFAMSSQAQTATPKATKRQVNQQKRIKQGVRSGELTKKETVQLQAQQKHIQKTKKRAKADGKVTPKERAKIQHKQNRASKNIKSKRSNSRTRD
ncbi:MAG: hypothetical protein AAGG75_02515 [Bacteroidota bacterium]